MSPDFKEAISADNVGDKSLKVTEVIRSFSVADALKVLSDFLSFYNCNRLVC